MSIRRPRRAVLAVGTLLLLAIAPAALAGGADTVTVVERQVDVNPGETNPCTGATGTIVDDEQDVFHITALADGTLNLTGHSTVSITFTPDDPLRVAYQGHETFALSETTTNRIFVTTLTNHVRVKGTDGTFVTVRAVAHLTVSPSGITAVFDRPTFACS
jgi:hypothetical protein